MERILIISSIIPIKALGHKKRENDILLTTEERIIKEDSSIQFEYIFIFPYANKILSKYSDKWKNYWQLKKRSSYPLRNKEIQLLPLFLLPKKFFFRGLLLNFSLFKYRKRIQNIIQTFQPTQIHAQDVDSSAFIARKLGKKYSLPYHVTLRGINSISDKIVKNNIQSAQSIVAINTEQQKIGAPITKKEIHFIPHGVDEYFYTTNFKPKISLQPIRLITVARLIPLKNIDLIIETLNQSHVDFIFNIYGEGPEKEKLLQLTKDLKLAHKIFFKGYVNHKELPSILQKHHLFIMPSFPETLGRVYFEAMASGLPVIASVNTGIDGIIKDRKHGYLLNPVNKKEFISNLNSILDYISSSPEEYNKLSQNAISLSQEFSWSHIIPKYIDLYHKDSSKQK